MFRYFQNVEEYAGKLPMKLNPITFESLKSAMPLLMVDE
jgi:hypothetical protein